MNFADQPRHRWRSLELRLPLLVCLLLLVVVASIGVLGTRLVQSVLQTAAEEHARQGGTQLAGLLESSAASGRLRADTLAAHPALRASGGVATLDRDAAAAELTRVLSPQNSAIGGGIVDAAGEWVLWVPGPAGARSGDPRPAPSPVGSAAPETGPIRAEGDTVFYDVAAPLAAGDGSARLVLRYRVVAGDQARLLAGLVGENAVFLLGSAGLGSAWSDLQSPVEAPRPGPGGSFRWNGALHRGSEVAVAGTPWSVWVGLPRAQVLAPARRVARQAGLIVFAVLLAGAAGAWLVGRHITRPITRLTEAVWKVSGGAAHARVPVRGHDEVAELARAFNVMAARVEAATHHLEAQVEERTEELSSALEDLQGAQEQLVRREKLAILGQLASGVGHELRNPFGVMTNAVYFLDAISPDATDQVREYHGILRSQLALAEKIVADLLDFARVREPERSPVQLGALVEQQLDRLDVPEDLRIEREFASGIPAAWIDPVQIGQVIFNLLTNAMQAVESAEGPGRLTLRTRAAGAGEVALEVSDTGPGIAAEDLTRIFEPLFTTRARGIGLGLAVSRGLTTANGGSLEVESRPGEGTTFTLTVPAEEP